MDTIADQSDNTLFANEQECISYLFHKRWPDGFLCPFCDNLQPEMSPAHTVVCRYCRKQSSITANTLMHGSKKSLMEWVQVSIQFCLADDGISARALQNSFHLSSYQTAWNWLRHLRKAAAIAEGVPLAGTIVIAPFSLVKIEARKQTSTQLICCYELPEPVSEPGRLQLCVSIPQEPLTTSEFILRAVNPGAVITINDSFRAAFTNLQGRYRFVPDSREINEKSGELETQLQQWMDHLYRGATASRYTQDYLDEFTFRHNTRPWTSKFKRVDHLLTGLLHSDTPSKRKKMKSERAGS